MICVEWNQQLFCQISVLLQNHIDQFHEVGRVLLRLSVHDTDIIVYCGCFHRESIDLAGERLRPGRLQVGELTFVAETVDNAVEDHTIA